MARHLSLLLVTAVLIFGLVSFATHLDNPDGIPVGGTGVTVSAVVALLVLALTRSGPWKASGAWLALALVGNAAALQLIDAGRLLHYQHYPLDPRSLQPEERFLVLVIVAQAALVLWAWKDRITPAVRCLRSEVAGWRLAAVGAAFFLTSAALSPHWSTYLGELALATVIQAINLLTIILVAWDAPSQPLVLMGRALGPEPRSRDDTLTRRAVPWLPPIVALWVTGLAAFLSLMVYEAHPHVPDEVAYYLQARYFAQGKLFLEAPPVPEAFEVYCMFHSGDRWFSVFPPGWPAILAAGIAVGAGWLVNPLLGGVNVLLAYALVREVWGKATATVLVLLIAASPWFVFMAMNLMSHTLTLTAALLSFWGLVRSRRSGGTPWVVVSGVAFGALALTRPFDAVVTLFLLCVAAIWPRSDRLSLRSLFAFLAGALAVMSVLLFYNKQLTGSPTSFPADTYYTETFGPGRYGIGFGSERGLGWPIDAFPGHGPFEALVNTMLNLFSVNIELLGWSTGSLLMILALVAFGRPSARDLFLALSICTVMAGYGLFWYHGGPEFGARYWFLIIVPCLVLTVRGAQELALALRKAGVARSSGRVAVALLALCAISLSNYLPWRAADKYLHFLNMSPHLPEVLPPGGERGALVLVKGALHPDYAAAAALNPLDWSSPETVYARDLESSNEALVKRYRGRQIWRVEGPSLTGGGYRVVGSEGE